MKQKGIYTHSGLYLFSHLFIACQSREEDLNNFSSQENHPYPPALSDYGIVRKGSKSDVIACLKYCRPPELTEPETSGLNQFDGPAIVHMTKPGISQILFQYIAMMSSSQLSQAISRQQQE